MTAWALVAVAAVLVAFLSSPVASQNGPSWQDAIDRLAAERTRAVTCVGLLKRHAADDTALSRGQLAYGEAKARMDAIIARLVVVVTEGRGPDAVPDLQRRLDAAVAARLAFCEQATASLPEDEGTKPVVGDVLAAVDGLFASVVALVDSGREADRWRRDTMRVQLEAQRWPDFADVGA